MMDNYEFSLARMSTINMRKSGYAADHLKVDGIKFLRRNSHKNLKRNKDANADLGDIMDEMRLTNRTTKFEKKTLDSPD